MDKLMAIFNWAWGLAPQWRRYLVIFVLGFLLSLLLSQCAFATDESPPPGDTSSTATATSTSTAAAAADSSSGGNSLSVSEEAGAPAVLLVPNNNTESCLRVFGFAASGDDGAAVFGVPYRSVQCDLEASADDAFAQGNFTLGWIFKCKMRSQQKAFGSERACLDATSSAVARQAELRQLRVVIDDLTQRNEVLSSAKTFTAAQADERCARKERDCQAGK